jgi:hypothetical protein
MGGYSAARRIVDDLVVKSANSIRGLTSKPT